MKYIWKVADPEVTMLISFKGYLDILPATEEECGVKLVEDHPSPAAVAGLQNVQSLQCLLAESPLPLHLTSVQREEFVPRGPAVQPTQTVLQPHQHGVAGMEDPLELPQHLLQLLHLHAGLQHALQVGLDGEDEFLYLACVHLDRALRAGPEIWVWRGQERARPVRKFLQTEGALDSTGQTACLPWVPAPHTPADKQLAGQQRVLPGRGGGQQLRVADADLLPRLDPPDGERVQHQVVAVVVNILLSCRGATV